MSCGFHKACKACPFSFLCLMGKLCNDYSSVERGQVYLCPKCGCTCMERQPFAQVRCPSRKLKGAWKGGWTSKFRDACRQAWEQHQSITYDALSTAITVRDPMDGVRRLHIYLCEACWQDPPYTGVTVSLYDPGVIPEPP